MAASEPSDSTASNEGDPVGVARTAGESGQSRITRDQGVCAEDPRGSSTAAVRSPLKRSTSSAWLRSTASGRLGCVAAWASGLDELVSQEPAGDSPATCLPGASTPSLALDTQPQNRVHLW